MSPLVRSEDRTTFLVGDIDFYCARELNRHMPRVFTRLRRPCLKCCITLNYCTCIRPPHLLFYTLVFIYIFYVFILFVFG
jgi:hypothetical protein